MEQAFIEEAEKYPGLGPGYFAARKSAAKFVDGFDADQFEPIVKKASEDFYQKLLDDVQSYLASNVEDNLQGEIWRGVDDGVKALLTGEKWALTRYALTDRHDGAKLREAICKHIPAELMSARLVDLEAENAQLSKDLAWERQHRR